MVLAVLIFSLIRQVDLYLKKIIITEISSSLQFDGNYKRHLNSRLALLKLFRSDSFLWQFCVLCFHFILIIFLDKSVICIVMPFYVLLLASLLLPIGFNISYWVWLLLISLYMYSSQCVLLISWSAVEVIYAVKQTLTQEERTTKSLA